MTTKRRSRLTGGRVGTLPVGRPAFAEPVPIAALVENQRRTGKPQWAPYNSEWRCKGKAGGKVRCGYLFGHTGPQRGY